MKTLIFKWFIHPAGTRQGRTKYKKKEKQSRSL